MKTLIFLFLANFTFSKIVFLVFFKKLDFTFVSRLKCFECLMIMLTPKTSIIAVK